MWKESLVVTSRLFTELYREFLLIVKLSGHDFIILVHSAFCCFQGKMCVHYITVQICIHIYSRYSRFGTHSLTSNEKLKSNFQKSFTLRSFSDSSYEIHIVTTFWFSCVSLLCPPATVSGLWGLVKPQTGKSNSRNNTLPRSVRRRW